MPKGQGRHTTLRVTLTPADRRTLEGWQRASTCPFGLARRGRILLLLADRMTLTEIARTVGISRRFVYLWIYRFQRDGIAGLIDRPRNGHLSRTHHYLSEKHAEVS